LLYQHAANYAYDTKNIKDMHYSMRVVTYEKFGLYNACFSKYNATKMQREVQTSLHILYKEGYVAGLMIRRAVPVLTQWTDRWTMWTRQRT